MTIYKTQTGEKKNEKDPELLTEPLTKEDAEYEDGAPKLVRVTYFPHRRRTWVNLCLIMTALLVLGTGTIAAILLYRHLSTKVVRGRCGVTVTDEYYLPQQADTPGSDRAENMHDTLYVLEEDIEVSDVENYERMSVPKFDDVAETVIWHDFTKNLTAIVDPNRHTCYIMDLNRTAIAPPRNLIDLLLKLKTHYYMPKASVVREQYRMVLPPMATEQLSELGKIIEHECYDFNTFRLEKIVKGVWKRSADRAVEHKKVEIHYGFFSLQSSESQNHVYKYDLFMDEDIEAPADHAHPSSTTLPRRRLMP